MLRKALACMNLLRQAGHLMRARSGILGPGAWLKWLRHMTVSANAALPESIDAALSAAQAAHPPGRSTVHCRTARRDRLIVLRLPYRPAPMMRESRRSHVIDRGRRFFTLSWMRSITSEKRRAPCTTLLPIAPRELG